MILKCKYFKCAALYGGEGIIKRHKASQALWGKNSAAAVAAGV